MPWRGYTTCWEGAETGESGLNMWCRPQLLYLNTYYEHSEWETSGVIRKWLACHELGHLVGLQHAIDDFHANWDESCMRDGDVTGPPDLKGFDEEHLTGCYPHHPMGQVPICRD